MHVQLPECAVDGQCSRQIVLTQRAIKRRAQVLARAFGIFVRRVVVDPHVRELKRNRLAVGAEEQHPLGAPHRVRDTHFIQDVHAANDIAIRQMSDRGNIRHEQNVMRNAVQYLGENRIPDDAYVHNVRCDGFPSNLRPQIAGSITS
jgi:hypothetical protein